MLLRLLLDCVRENLDISQVANRILLFRAALLEFRPQPPGATLLDFPSSSRTWFRRSRRVELGLLLEEPYREPVEEIVQGWVLRQSHVLDCAEDLRWALTPGPCRFLCIHAICPEFVIPPVEALHSWARGRREELHAANFGPELPRL